jgi:hypothetical protein
VLVSLYLCSIYPCRSPTSCSHEENHSLSHRNMPASSHFKPAIEVAQASTRVIDLSGSRARILSFPPSLSDSLDHSSLVLYTTYHLFFVQLSSIFPSYTVRTRMHLVCLTLNPLGIYTHEISTPSSNKSHTCFSITHVIAYLGYSLSFTRPLPW